MVFYERFRLLVLPPVCGSVSEADAMQAESCAQRSGGAGFCAVLFFFLVSLRRMNRRRFFAFFLMSPF
jgi:hypothetical protein